MSITKKLAIVAAVLVVLIGARILTSISGPDDQTQINQALDEAIQASREGRPGGVMDKLSSNLTVNSESAAGNWQQIANTVKEQRPDFDVPNRKIVISGDEARMESPVTMKLSVLSQTHEVQLDDVTMTFRKEDDHIYLVIPVRRWKLAEVQVPPAALTNLMQ